MYSCTMKQINISKKQSFTSLLHASHMIAIYSVNDFNQVFLLYSLSRVHKVLVVTRVKLASQESEV